MDSLTNCWRRLPRPGRSGRPLAGGIVFGLVVMWSIFAGLAYTTHRDAWARATIFADDVTSLLEQDIARNIELYDLSIQATVRDMDDPRFRGLPPATLRDVVFDRSADASGLGSMVVLDARGVLVLDSKALAKPGLDLSDREYFKVQRDRADTAQPFVSHPFVSRLSNHVMIALSRRRTAADGSFAGVVAGTMTLDYFGRLFDLVHLPRDSSIGLVHRDGTILLREPAVAGQANTSRKATELLSYIDGQEAGTFLKQSTYDSVERLFAFKQVGALPIYMTVGFSTREVLRAWRWQIASIGVAFLILTLTILTLGFILALELDRRTKAEAALGDLAATDAVTALANRRRFDEALDIEWRRAVRDRTALSLLMIDGDFFKAFNDTYGHVEGDHALRRVAETIRGCLARPGDMAARFGGEEFVVLLADTEIDGACRVASAIRRAVHDLWVPHGGSPIGLLTVSIGVASRRPTATGVASEILEDADAALYAAKAEGRDRVVVAEEGDGRGWRSADMVA